MISRILKRSTDRNEILTERIQQESRLNYYRFLATRQFNYFKEHYEFSANAIDELQQVLNSQFDKIPYGWQIPQIDSGITNIIKSFIDDRKVNRRNTEHISI